MNLIKRSFLNALGVTAYIMALAFFFQYASTWFGPDKKLVTPAAALMLFVLSAAVTGGLVLGKPAVMYFNDQKSEAVKLFLYTIAWLFLGTLIFMLLNLK